MPVPCACLPAQLARRTALPWAADKQQMCMHWVYTAVLGVTSAPLGPLLSGLNPDLLNLCRCTLNPKP